MAPTRGLLSLVLCACLFGPIRAGISPSTNECTRENVQGFLRYSFDKMGEMVTLGIDERTPQCGYLKYLVEQIHVLMVNCKESVSDEDWGSDSFESQVKYEHSLHFKELATAYTLLCSMPLDSNDTLDVMEDQEATGACVTLDVFDLVANYLISEIDMPWGDDAACQNATEGLEIWDDAVRGCAWETKSILNLFRAQSESTKLVVCASPSCNIRYAELCIAQGDNVHSLYESDSIHNKTDYCRTLKHSLACVTTHTRTCTADIYGRVSEDFDQLRKEYGADKCDTIFPPPMDEECTEPAKTLVEAVEGSVSIFMRTTICEEFAHSKSHTDEFSCGVTSSSTGKCPSIQHVRETCTGLVKCDFSDETYNCLNELIIDCTFTDKVTIYSNMISRGACSDNHLIDSDINKMLDQEVVELAKCVDLIDYTKVDQYPNCSYLQSSPLQICLESASRTVPMKTQTLSYLNELFQFFCIEKQNETCYIDSVTIPYLTLPLLNLWIWPYNGLDSDRLGCLRLGSAFDSLAAEVNCGNADGEWQKLQEIVAKICAYFRDCEPKDLKTCLDPFITNQEISDSMMRTFKDCADNKTKSCLEPWGKTYYDTVLGIADSFGGGCKKSCDPAGAVHCIMDVHHMAKQAIPDWTGICSKLNETHSCSERHIRGCDECKRNTVTEIVTSLNHELETTCEDPPHTECEAIKAIGCIEKLEQFYVSGDNNNDNVCSKLVDARHCVSINVEKCDWEMGLSIRQLLEYKISKYWRGVECDVDEQLRSCLEIFSEGVDQVLAVDVDSLIVQMDQGQDRPYNISEFFHYCGEVERSWSCVESTLSVKNNNVETSIVRTLLTSTYIGVERQCKAPREVTPPQCYSCQREGAKSCSRDEIDVKQCGEKEVCRTVTESLGSLTFSVLSRGCEPEETCIPKFDEDMSTYCCRGNLCNNMTTGPIQGGCNYKALSQCVFDLSAEYLDTDTVQCSSVDESLECIDHEKLKCELAGYTFMTESFSNLSLSADIEQCRLKEVDLSCDAEKIIASINFISSFSVDVSIEEMCITLNETHSMVLDAKKICDDDEYQIILEAYHSLETTIGNLDCDGHYGIVVEVNCKPVEAVDCIFHELNITTLDEAGDITCETYQRIETCMGALMTQCDSALQFLMVTWRQKWLMQKVTTIETCQYVDFVEEKENLLLIKIYTCIRRYSDKLSENGSTSFYDAADALQSCLFDLDVDYIRDQKKILHMHIDIVTYFLQIIMTWRYEIEITTQVELSSQCQMQVNAVLGSHGNLAFILPFLSVMERSEACGTLEYSVESMISACGERDIAAYLLLLDALREKLLLSYCPRVRPIARCYISEAEECLSQFTSSFDLGSTNLCMEAEAFVSCASAYTATCESSDALLEFKQRSQFAVSFVSQACIAFPQLIQKTRCTLTTETIIGGVCDLDNLITCTEGITDCSGVLRAKECFDQKIEGCPDGVEVTFSLLSEVEECREGSQSDGENTTTVIVTESCEVVPYECNVDKAKQCLVDLLTNGPYITDNEVIAKTCLEENYYCFASVMSLARLNITQFSYLMVHFLAITPSWQLMESQLLIELLTLPQYVSPIIEINSVVSLNLWDICWRLDQIHVRLEKVHLQYGDNAIPFVMRSMKRVSTMISSLCNNVDLMKWTLKFPESGEEAQSCPASDIKSQFDFVFAQAITEFYASSFEGDKTMCRQYRELEMFIEYSALETACSSGFQAQVRFTLKAIQGILGDSCSGSKYSWTRRCNVQEVKMCVKEIYKTIRLLGQSTTKGDVCRVLDIAEQCVEANSYKCDSCAASRINWLYSRAKAQAVQFCSRDEDPPTCEDDDTSCDETKAHKCSLGNFRSLVNPFLSKSQRCRKLAQNSQCISDASDECDAPFENLFLSDKDQVDSIQQEYGCQEDELNLEEGCTKYCNLKKVSACYSVFYQKMAYYKWGRITQPVCQQISGLRTCLDNAVLRCETATYKIVFKKFEAILAKFPGHDETCIDSLECAKRFDELVRQIKDTDYDPEVDTEETKDMDTEDKDSKSKDSKAKDSKAKDSKAKDSKAKDSKAKDSNSKDKDSNSKDKDSNSKDKDSNSKDKGSNSKDKGSKDKNSITKEKKSKSKEKKSKDKVSTQEDDRPDPPGSTLLSLCSQVRQQWNCIQDGLQWVSSHKRRTLKRMYSELWAIVQEKCTKTSELECYKCKDEDDFENCLKDQQTCSHNKQTCYVRRKDKGGKIEYEAGCRTPSSCGSAPNEYCCTDYLCNDGPIKETTRTSEVCEYGNSLTCALDFTLDYFRYEKVRCSAAQKDLSCIQSFSTQCGASLKSTASDIFLELAISTCVVNSESDDCYSLALDSMFTILQNAYTTLGQSSCKALENAETSVTAVINSDKCDEAGKTSLRQGLEFVRAIVGSQCESALCETKTIYYKQEVEASCSGEIFEGIRNIYGAYIGLNKQESERECGRCKLQAQKANRLLSNCGISGFLETRLVNLDSELSTKCSKLSEVEMPTACPGLCSGKVLFEYANSVQSLIVSLNETDTTSCWYLSEVEKAYYKFTEGCSSIQQSDISAELTRTFKNTVAMCQSTSIYWFELTIKRDVYYDAVICEKDFDLAIENAIGSEDPQPEDVCTAVEEWNNCDFSLPTLLSDFVIQDTNEKVQLVEELTPCNVTTDTNSSDDRDKRDASCTADYRKEVLKNLNDIPQISSADMDIRDQLCRSADDVIKEADNAITNCKDKIHPIFINLIQKIRDHQDEKNKQICITTFYEEPECKLDLMSQCVAEFSTVDQYALLDQEVICRQAKIALECLDRFTFDCKDGDKETADFIHSQSKTILKQMVGNTCPLLTAYFYCDGLVTSTQSSCRLEEAAGCTSNVNRLYWENTEETCPSLKGNITCTADAFAGCTEQAVDSVDVVEDLPEIPDTRCDGLSAFGRDSICTSTPVCSSQSTKKCLFNKALETCSDFEDAVTCNNAFRRETPWCGNSVDVWLTEKSFSVFYESLGSTCGGLIWMIPDAYVGTSLEVLMVQTFLAVATKNGTVADLVYTLLTPYRSSLHEDFKELTLTLLLDVVTQIDVQSANHIDLESGTLEFYEHYNGCSYTGATVCVAEQLIKVLTFKLLTHDEKTEFCDAYFKQSAETCVASALKECHGEDRFKLWLNYANTWTESLGLCNKPELCIVSEGFQCTHSFGYSLTQYDITGNVKDLCQARFDGEDCLKTFVGECSKGEDTAVLETFQTLSNKVEPECEDFPEPKPPICPNIPERNRLCNLGNAFRCVARFNMRILNAGDSLLWRQQCFSIQDMMVCVATNTTSCDPEDEDVKTIMDSLEVLRQTSAYRCPWQTDDMCTKEAPCPVVTAGCEVTLEQGLLNRESSVCELKREADECIADNTKTCNEAQKYQATKVVENKLKAVGLPKNLDCSSGSMDGAVYNYLSACKDYSAADDKTAACSTINTLSRQLTAQYINPDNNEFIDLGKDLADVLEGSLCPHESSCTDIRTPVRELSTLISQLMLNENLDDTSFCAQSLTILNGRTTNACLNDTYTFMETAVIYKSKCEFVRPSCSNASTSVTTCIQNIDNSEMTDCQFATARASCVAEFLPIGCPVDTQWEVADNCSSFIAVQADTKFGSVRYISEAGLGTTFTFQRFAGWEDARVECKVTAVNKEEVPSCLKGSSVNKPIPQVYLSSYSLQFESNQCTVELNAVQDYRIDGSQEVDVEFTVVPLTLVSGTKGVDAVWERIEESSFTFPKQRVKIADRDLKSSTCSSINDPHIKTFDNVKYNNMMEGEFILYRSTKQPAAVTVEFVQCAQYGTCNCATTVYAGSSYITFDSCGEDKGTILFHAKDGSTQPDQQLLSVTKEENQKTYHIVILTTGTMVTVRLSGDYMNVWVMPSGMDIGATQGLCGVYDGQGYNDFELRDFTDYQIKSNDSKFNVLSPDDFNADWAITQESSEVFLEATKDIVNEVSSQCISWENEDGLQQQCGTKLHLGSCGFADGDDITALLFEVYQQVSQSVTRRKRRAVTRHSVNRNITSTGFPTLRGITLEQAEETCSEYLNDQTLEACREALASISDDYDIPDMLDTCIDDIRLSDNLTFWLAEGQDAAALECEWLLSKIPGYQKNTTARDLSVAYMDKTCLPRDCHGRGTCVSGACICASNYAGSSCEYHESELKTPPTLTKPAGSGVNICPITRGSSECKAVYISGQGFIPSKWLTCHLREIEISETGVIRSVSNSETTVKAELLTIDQVRCPFGEASYVKKTLEVSVSNDGVHKYPEFQPFLAYDPECHSCEGHRCTQRENVCIIGKACVRSGETSVYNDCHYCSLNNPYKWSVYSERAECKHLLPTEKDDDDDNDALSIALIVSGCVIAILLAILIGAVCLVLKRRKRDQRGERPPQYAAHNPGYEHGFYGEPAPAYHNNHEQPSFRLQKMA